MAKAAGKAKPSPIAPFLYHLYKSGRCLMAEEEVNYEVGGEMGDYHFTPDRDPQPANREVTPNPGSPTNSPTGQPTGQPSAPSPSSPPQPGRPTKRQKHTPRGETRKSPPQPEGERRVPVTEEQARLEPSQPDPVVGEPGENIEIEDPEEEETQPWVSRPFEDLKDILGMVKGQYYVLQNELVLTG